jgi:hypothetical protein
VKEISNKYIISEDGQVLEEFTLEACEYLLSNYGYRIEDKKETHERNI